MHVVPCKFRYSYKVTASTLKLHRPHSHSSLSELLKPHQKPSLSLSLKTLILVFGGSARAVMAASIAFNQTAMIAPKATWQKIAPLRRCSSLSATIPSMQLRSFPLLHSRSESSSAFSGNTKHKQQEIKKSHLPFLPSFLTCFNSVSVELLLLDERF